MRSGSVATYRQTQDQARAEAGLASLFDTPSDTPTVSLTVSLTLPHYQLFSLTAYCCRGFSDLQVMED